MVDRSALAKIHIAKKELGLTDEAYRDMLHLHFSVASAKDLTPRQVLVLLNKLRARGWQPKSPAKARKKAAGPGFIEITPGPAASQQRKVLAMWNALGYEPEKLHGRCKKQFNVDRFEWVTEYDDLHILITDLEHRLRRMGQE